MSNQTFSQAINSQDYLDTTAIFGDVKKVIYSKNFQGGRVHSLFGAVKLDFTNADIHGVVIIDVSQAFSETKILVPNKWRVETDVTHILSSTDDKRRSMSDGVGSDKVLVITGVSTFACVTVKSSL